MHKNFVITYQAENDLAVFATSSAGFAKLYQRLTADGYIYDDNGLLIELEVLQQFFESPGYGWDVFKKTDMVNHRWVRSVEVNE